MEAPGVVLLDDEREGLAGASVRPPFSFPVRPRLATIPARASPRSRRFARYVARRSGAARLFSARLRLLFYARSRSRPFRRRWHRSRLAWRPAPPGPRTRTLASLREIDMRAFWSGEIAFGLVTIPAKLYTATKDLTPQFHQLHKECGTRINVGAALPQVQPRSPLGRDRQGLRGRQGRVRALHEGGAREARRRRRGRARSRSSSSSTRSRSTSRTSRRATGSAPAARTCAGYQLLRTVLDDVKKVALAKVKIRTRTRLALLRPRGRLFSLDMMRFAEELVPGDEIAPAEGKESSDREKQLALHLVDELSGPFDPARAPRRVPERGARRGRREGRSGRGRARHDGRRGARRRRRGGRRRRAGHRPRGAPVAIDQERREARPGQDEGRRRGRGRGEAREGQGRPKKKRATG